MIKSVYTPYVKLLLETLPHVADEKIFSLKGGTAINLFVRNLPRLSVDIDLTYTGLETREKAIKSAEASLARIKSEIEKHIPKAKVLIPTKSGADNIKKLFVVQNGIQIKIEANPVIRGTIFDGEDRDLVENAQKEFGVSMSVPVVSLPDLYGGKIVAALDRQHPRDLFDIHLLFQHEGITPDILKGFLVYLSSHHRTFHEVLSPTKKDMRKIYADEFEGMTNIPFSYTEFEKTRDLLITKILSELTNDQRQYLISLQENSPNWKLLDLDGVKDLPAVKWKLENINKMSEGKRAESVKDLKKVLKV